MDSEIGLSVVDRFSHKFFEFVKESTPDSTIQNFIDNLDPEFLGSTPIYRGDLFDRSADKIRIFDFVAGKKREDVETGINRCESVYEKLVQEEMLEKPYKPDKSESKRRLYKIDFETKILTINNITLTLTLLITFASSWFFKSIL